MYKTIRIQIGPDFVEGGINWYLSARRKNGDWEDHDSGGWSGTGPIKKDNPNAWLALAKRKIGLPPFDGVKRWADADVTPDGWSQGAGHAPHGIRIEWTL